MKRIVTVAVHHAVHRRLARLPCRRSREAEPRCQRRPPRADVTQHFYVSSPAGTAPDAEVFLAQIGERVRLRGEAMA